MRDMRDMQESDIRYELGYDIGLQHPNSPFEEYGQVIVIMSDYSPEYEAYFMNKDGWDD